ncbi:MAG TPA: TetR/AcrR family transcriptional regulator [Pseudobdellovibrionaceae bacterium]|nr:TetR/AcrR family transcriptional regulator [Pseudobdellovibrionaceae bacterium]
MNKSFAFDRDLEASAISSSTTESTNASWDVQMDSPPPAAETAPISESGGDHEGLRRKKREKMRDRDSTFWRVLNAALELDFRKGHLKWTMSDLSRKSGITRSLIYYHFGRSKSSILREAISVIGEEIVATNPERTAMWRDGRWAETVKLSRDVANQAPNLCNFYLTHRDRPTEIGEEIRSLEATYIRKLQRLFPEFEPAAIRAMFGFFFGIVFAPHVDDEAVQVAIRALKKLTGRGFN